MTAPHAIALTTTVVRSDELICAEMGNERVMMSLEQGEYFGLDAIGSRIWALLEHPMTVAELCQQLVASYAVDVETCQQDTLDFLQELYAAEIITIVDTPAA
jgi:hypothetical protein